MTTAPPNRIRACNDAPLRPERDFVLYWMIAARRTEAYANLQSPTVNAAMLQKGGEIYATSCASCHGDGGLGDGPAASALDPAPAPLSHTSQMMSDGYLYWRTTEGGVEFGSVMPAWKSVLSETEIWSVLAYVRALGRGEVAPASSVGGAAADPQFEAKQHERMVAQAVEQKLITQAEADNFLLVHAALDTDRTEPLAELPNGAKMKIQEVRTKAKALGLRNTFGLSKAELIRRIQKAEGNYDCFGTAKDYCDQFQCCFREDCFKFIID